MGRSLIAVGRLIASCILAVLCASNARLFASELTIPRGGSADDRVNAVVEFRAEGTAVSALQFDLRYSAGVLAVTATAGSAATDAGKLLTTTVLANGDLRVLIFGFNQTVISDGVVGSLSIQLRTPSAAGTHTLGLANVSGATGVRSLCR
jgi:hypothetical protein